MVQVNAVATIIMRIDIFKETTLAEIIIDAIADDIPYLKILKDAKIPFAVEPIVVPSEADHILPVYNEVSHGNMRRMDRDRGIAAMAHDINPIPDDILEAGGKIN